MGTKFFKKLWTEHDIAIFATLATYNTNDHALAIDVADFQMCQLITSYSSGIERHQQSAMIGSPSCFDELRDFFLTENRWQTKHKFRIRCFGNTPGTLECLDVEESQRRQMSDD